MIGPLNHVGVAVPSIEKAIDTYQNLYNVETKMFVIKVL